MDGRRVTGRRRRHPPPVTRAPHTAKARPWHAAVVAGALAGLSFAHGAYLTVIGRTHLW
ncbi:hypothetical protein AB0E88_25620 [Streptomyces sp. NPDC028635]|uniref:hypothetical protein n=1 Tax=Streptomyces sp. NPDC028635 TaxID=3154800 RepID=UPI0033C89D68